MTNGAMYTSENTENFNKGNNGGSRAEGAGVAAPSQPLSWADKSVETKQKQRIN